MTHRQHALAIQVFREPGVAVDELHHAVGQLHDIARLSLRTPADAVDLRLSVRGDKAEFLAHGDASFCI